MHFNLFLWTSFLTEWFGKHHRGQQVAQTALNFLGGGVDGLQVRLVAVVEASPKHVGV
jgi:hypothetical protein